MKILDTNVISELQKKEPNELVVQYVNSLDPTSTYITSITVGELLYGVDILPLGRRKQELEDSVFKIIKEVFKNRVLPYDFDAASHYAINAASAKRYGNAVGLADGMIAGIARANTVEFVVTRDSAPFEAMGITVINPWEPQVLQSWTVE